MQAIRNAFNIISLTIELQDIFGTRLYDWSQILVYRILILLIKGSYSGLF